MLKKEDLQMHIKSVTHTIAIAIDDERAVRLLKGDGYHMRFTRPPVEEGESNPVITDLTLSPEAMDALMLAYMELNMSPEKYKAILTRLPGGGYNIVEEARAQTTADLYPKP